VHSKPSPNIQKFFIGILLVIIGIVMLFKRVIVHGGLMSLFFGSSFGATLMPFLIGVGILFFNPDSRTGWIIMILGLLIIILSIVASLKIYFLPTSLWEIILILGFLASGTGLTLSSLKPSNTAQQNTYE